MDKIKMLYIMIELTFLIELILTKKTVKRVQYLSLLVFGR